MKQISNIQGPSSIDKSLKKKQTNVNENDSLIFKTIILAPIATASFCGAKRIKRYSGKRD
ncbi:hypothetical protein [Chryseobacterium sp. JK1]|uniref:hypothetical protein n=1 Tax=Chryseobacterium sp. JK1 TaxID=874294 RepID=UPI003D69DA32